MFASSADTRSATVTPLHVGTTVCANDPQVISRQKLRRHRYLDIELLSAEHSVRAQTVEHGQQQSESGNHVYKARPPAPRAKLPYDQTAGQDQGPRGEHPSAPPQFPLVPTDRTCPPS